MYTAFERKICYDAYQRALRSFGMVPVLTQNKRDLPCADLVMMGDVTPVMWHAGSAVELLPMRFGLQTRSSGTPIYYAPSEGLDFQTCNRCLIPISAIFGFPAEHATHKYRFTLIGESFMCIAGIWCPSKGNGIPSFAVLTSEPAADLAQYLDRQVVILRPVAWDPWLRFSSSGNSIMRPLDADALAVETLRKDKRSRIILYGRLSPLFRKRASAIFGNTEFDG